MATLVSKTVDTKSFNVPNTVLYVVLNVVVVLTVLLVRTVVSVVLFV